MIEIEDECGCDADRGEEGVGASIIAGRDAPPILEPRKHDLDFVALLIERLVIGQRDFPAFGRGNAGFALLRLNLVWLSIIKGTENSATFG